MTVSRGYDGLMRPATLTVPSTGNTVGMTYRDGSRLDTVSSTLGGTATTHVYTYQPNSGLIATLTQKNATASFLTTTRRYDFLNRLSSIVGVPAAATSMATSYGYNGANQRITGLEADGKYWDYSYDSLGQVTTGTKHLASGTALLGHTFGYAFDTIGNRLTSAANGHRQFLESVSD